APMGGGASTPELASAVSKAGGLGFLAGGYKTADAMRQEIIAIRKLTDAPFGVNLFVPDKGTSVDAKAVSDYKERLKSEADRLGVSLGEPLADDDDWDAKLSIITEQRVPVVSFTFGCPSLEIIEALKNNGSLVVVTVTTPQEAVIAKQAGADAICVQGVEAGAHRASFVNKEPNEEDRSLLVLLRLVRQVVDTPIIAAGGITHGSDVAAMLMAGACAAQLGTAFLLCPESGTHPVHKAALTDPQFSSTTVTRAFTGRNARGLVNRFMSDYNAVAPMAYPQIHHMTKTIRKAAGETNDPNAMSLWAGQGYPFAKAVPAAEIVNELMAQARQGL
ncbi:NAD(P)H-dependent flavin oxidoreductase, partial [Jeotgalibacillus marinus]